MNTHSSPQPIPTSRSNNNTTTGSNTSSRDLHSGPSFHLQRQQPLHHHPHHHPHHHQHQHQRPPLVKRSHSHGGCLDSDRASTLLGSGGRRPLNLFDDYLEDSPVEEALFASDDEEAQYDHRGSDGGGDGIDSFGRQQQKVRLEENHRQYQRQQRQQQRHSLQTYPGHPLHPSQHAPAYMSDESAFMLGSSSPKPRSFLTSMPPHRRSFQGIHAIRKGQQEVEEENEDEEVVVVEEEEEEVVEEQEDRMKKKKSRVGETHANSTKNDVKEEDAEPIVEKQLVEKGRPAQERGALQRNENGQRGGAHATTVVAAAAAAAAAITVTTPEPLHLLPPSPPPSTTTPTSNATRRVTRESGQQQQQQHQQSLKQGLQQHQHVQQQQQHHQHQQEQQQQQQQQQQESHAMSEDRRKSPVTTLSASGTNDSVGNDDSLSCLGGAQTTHAVARGASSEGVVGTAMNMTTTATASAPSPSLTPTPSLRVNRGTAHLSQHLHPSITIDTSSECLRRPFSGNNTGTTNASTHSIPSTHTHTHTHTNTNTTSTAGSNGSISEAFKARETPSTASAADVPTTTTTTATTTASTATTGLNCGSKLNDFSGPQSRPEGHLSMSLLQQKEKGERECQGQGQGQEKERQQQQQQQQQYDHLNVTRPMASAFSSSSPWSTLKNSSLPPAPPISSSSSSSSSLQYQQNVLLPSLSPTSPRTANPALVNSLDQLSLSWRAPEQTPSFPINRLHRSRTLSSGGLRPLLNGGGGGGTGGNMTMTAMASGGGSGSYFPACPTGSTLSSSSSFGPQSNPVPTVSPTTPMVTSSSYSSLPYSPAVAFLSNLVDVTTPALVNADDEGEAVGDFIMGKVIGHGGFSVVREAFATQVDGLVARVAVKVVKARTDGGKAINGRIHRMLRKEVAIWSRLSHPNVVPFVAVEKLPCATFVFCELCTGGSLLDYLAKRTAGKKTAATAASSAWGSLSAPTTSTTTGLPEEEARKIFNQIAAAVRYMHVEKQIVHRDIKLENVLQHEDGTWKVCDFGLAECQNEEAANYFFDSPLSPTFGNASSSSPSNSSSSHGSCRSSESSSSQSQASELMLSSSSSSSLSMSSSSATTQHGLLGSRQERSQSLTGLDVVMEDAAGEGQEDECDEAVEDEEQMVGGSLAYCSPEQLRSCVPLKTASSDVWSLGVVLYALLTGRLPFQDEYEPRLQYQILNGHYDDPTESSREARDLLRKMFHAKPEQRWRIDQVMDSAWCQGTTLEDSNSDVARFSSGGGVGGGMSASAFFGMGSMRF